MVIQVLEIFRQGDILFKRVRSIEDVDKKLVNGLTVALGELTGHHHSFVPGSLVQLYADPKDSTETPIAMEIMSKKDIAKVKGELDRASKGGIFGSGFGALLQQEVVVAPPTIITTSEQQLEQEEDVQRLVHNEHSSLLLPPGQYVIGREKEYNYWTKELVKTRD